MSSPRTLVRVAGWLYLVMFVGATFAGYVRPASSTWATRPHR
jgi:hypothetical protein